MASTRTSVVTIPSVDDRVGSGAYGVRACLYTNNTPLPDKPLLIYVTYTDGSREIFNFVTDGEGCVSTVVFNPRSITAVFEGDEDYEPSYASLTLPTYQYVTVPPAPTYPPYTGLTFLAVLILMLFILAYTLRRFKQEMSEVLS